MRWLQFCRNEAPPAIAMQQRLADAVMENIWKWGDINYVWHGMKRMPVSFVPFAVAAVNAIGMMRLVTRVLTVTGARGTAYLSETKHNCYSMVRIVGRVLTVTGARGTANQ